MRPIRFLPSRKVRRAITFLAVLAGAVTLASTVRSSLLLYLLYISAALLLGAVAATTLVWMLHAWRTPDALTESRLEDDYLAPAHSFSLIVPARHEEAVLETTLERLVHSDHPSFQILVVVGADDPATRDVAENIAGRHPDLVKVIIDPSWPKNKPKALNAALPYCLGTVTGVFDAEDDVHPALLRRVDQRFQKTGADVVQAGVQLMNFRSSWLTVHNVLEYYFWFRSRLHLHARQRFIPLGGNTVFIRTQVLRAVGGWDPDCLAEDCELGVRLSALGAHTVVFYEPELVTREECPPTLAAFVRQRTRWNQGYLQTLSKGFWRRLPLRQRALGVYILAMPYVLAIAWLLIPVAIGTAVAVKAPVPITLISFLPALPMLSFLVVEVVGLGEFCRAYGQRASARDYARLVFGLIAYQAVLTFAAARAVAREVRGVRGWEKTAHLGLHLPKPGDGERSGTPIDAPPEPARRPQPVAARFPDPRPSPVVPALFTTSSYGVVQLDLDAPGGGPIPSAAHRLLPDRLSTQPAVRAVGAGDDRGRWRHRLADHLLSTSAGDPLWVRLAGVSPSGSISPALPRIPALGFPCTEEGRLKGLLLGLGRLVRSHVDVAVQVPLLAGVGLVQTTNMLHWPAAMFDEGTYVANAWAVGQRGELGFYTYTYGHPPLGWLLITLWTSIGGLFGHATYSLDGARELMGFVTIVSCSLLYTLARRLKMSPAFAAGAVILFALSPLSLYFHRGVLLDNPATAWAIAAFVLALSPRRRLWSFVGSGACFAASALSKETTLILLPALLLAAIQHADARTRRYCVTLLASFFVLIGFAFPLYAILKGELLPGPGHVSLIGTDVNMLFTRQGSGSIFDPFSVAHGMVAFWLSLDPWLLGAAVLLSPIALARRDSRPIALAFVIQVAMILRPGYLPAMYVVALLPFAALTVAGTSQALWSFATSDLRGPRLSAAHAWGRRVGPRALARLTSAGIVASLVALIAGGAIAALYVAPRWLQADRAAMSVALDSPELAAQNWLVAHVGRKERLIVTDDFWIYLIDHGFDSHPEKGGFNSPTVVSYWPLDKDPAVRRFFPYGWREFDYVVSTAAMRVTAVDTPSTAQALQHSRLVASFGQGGARIEIRRITPTPIRTTAATGTRAYVVATSGRAPSLTQVARGLGVSVENILASTNEHPAKASWWYYEATHRYSSPLPPGTKLYDR